MQMIIKNPKMSEKKKMTFKVNLKNKLNCFLSLCFSQVSIFFCLIYLSDLFPFTSSQNNSY